MTIEIYADGSVWCVDIKQGMVTIRFPCKLDAEAFVLKLVKGLA